MSLILYFNKLHLEIKTLSIKFISEVYIKQSKIWNFLVLKLFLPYYPWGFRDMQNWQCRIWLYQSLESDVTSKKLSFGDLQQSYVCFIFSIFYVTLVTDCEYWFKIDDWECSGPGEESRNSFMWLVLILIVTSLLPAFLHKTI